jgi:hypothetical protein
VRSKPGDIRQVIEEARAADGTTPDLSQVLQNQKVFLDRPDLTPEYRQYVRRYFTVETDNR